jgi:hypothetical protein
MRLGSFITLLLAAGAFAQAPPPVQYPAQDEGVAALESRATDQRRTADQIRVFHEFHFTDRLAESGITFVHHVVDDAALNYKPVHYDHGNGVAVADVDGDGLPDIYFVNQVGGNQLWRNLGGGKFENITAKAGVAMASKISVAAAFGDIDNDGKPDLFVTTVRGGNVLFHNEGGGRFRDVTQTAGVGLVSHSSGAFFFDFDRDGLLDLLVCNTGRYTSDKKGAQGQYVGLPDAFSGHMYPERFEHPVLYKNLGHLRFRDVTAQMHLTPEGWSGDAAFADLNEDGWPDIYFLNMMGSNHYFENDHGKGFVEKTDSLFPATPWGAMGIRFFDFDNDGRPDLFVTDMHSDMFAAMIPELEKEKAATHPSESFLMGPPAKFVFGNALYHNLSSGKFEEVSDSMGVENYWPWGPSSGDLNADGWEDLFIASSMNFPFRYGINSLLLNDMGKKFRDAEFLVGVEPRKDGKTHTPWFQLNCDKMPPDPQGVMHTICTGRTGMVTVMVPLGSRSAAIFDLDNDGDLDIVTNDFNSAPQVLVSNLTEAKPVHFLKVQLTGTTSNRDALGAVVRVSSAGNTYTKFQDGKSGYLSQSSLPLYFGLGDADKADRVEVTWPSGKKQTVETGIPANGLLKITEER